MKHNSVGYLIQELLKYDPTHRVIFEGIFEGTLVIKIVKP